MPQDRPTLPSLADAGSALAETIAAPQSAESPVPPGPIRGIGIGIENLATFPEADSYLEHVFYRARFTPAELAYCAERASPRAGFCALAAVKRAVMNSGAAAGTPESLAAIEITCDEAGKPSYRDCSLSVDHTETTAVAVCLWMRAHEPAASAPVPVGRPLASYPPLQRLGIRILLGLSALSLLFVFCAGAWFILKQILR